MPINHPFAGVDAAFNTPTPLLAGHTLFQGVVVGGVVLGGLILARMGLERLGVLDKR